MERFVLLQTSFAANTVLNLVHLVGIDRFSFIVVSDDTIYLIELVLEACTQIVCELQEWHQVIYVAEEVVEDCYLLLLIDSISCLKPISFDCVVYSL